MAIFDERLIDPGEEALAQALGRAMRSANRENKYHDNRMTRDAAFWGRFARDVLRGGAEGRRRSCKGGRAVPEVIAGWWTDPAGRKHVRVIGRTRGWVPNLSRPRREGELRTLPPWWHVYPEAVLGVRGKAGGERYLAACRCGAIGAPESLGWMGDTCGPCFDRRADGGVPAGGFGQFGGWAAHLTRFGFGADGRHVVGQTVGGSFGRLSRADGTAAVVKRKSFNQLVAVGADESGATLVMQEGSVYRWPAGADELEQVLAGRRIWGRAALAPDGSRVAVLSYQMLLTADLTAGAPRYTRHEPADSFSAIQFTPDGSRLLMVGPAGELRAADPDTLRAEVIRGDAFDGLPGGYGPPVEMAVARDGSALLLRRESYYPRSVSVRHVPLPAGPVGELRLPEWHRPTIVALSPDARHAVTAETEGGWVGFWELPAGRPVGFVRAVLEGQVFRGGQVEFSPDGAAVAVAYSTGDHEHGSTIAVWPWPDVLQAAAG